MAPRTVGTGGERSGGAADAVCQVPLDTTRAIIEHTHTGVDPPPWPTETCRTGRVFLCALSSRLLIGPLSSPGLPPLDVAVAVVVVGFSNVSPTIGLLR